MDFMEDQINLNFEFYSINHTLVTKNMLIKFRLVWKIDGLFALISRNHKYDTVSALEKDNVNMVTHKAMVLCIVKYRYCHCKGTLQKCG